jgi:hypothetical protein
MVLGKSIGSEIFIGDIASDFIELVELSKNNKNRKLVALGDLNDRGQDTKSVFDFFMSEDNAVAIKGNHEDLMHDFVTKGKKYHKSNWILYGGLTTINSFCKKYKEKKNLTELGLDFFDLSNQIKASNNQTLPKEFYKIYDSVVFEIQNIAIQVIDKKYIEWIAQLPIYYETDLIIATHAPLNPNYSIDDLLKLSKKTPEHDDSVLWNRSSIIKRDKFQIFGHQNHKTVTLYKDESNEKEIYGMCIDTCEGKVLSAFDSEKDLILSVSR